MCGILGWQLKPTAELTEYQRAMMVYLLADDMEGRGRDSFGAALWLPDEAAPVVHRDLGKITQRGQAVFSLSMMCPMALMHTRTATVGDITVPNCHPFAIGDVLGVHNGSVYNWRELNTRYNRDFQVDSMHIMAHLDANLDMSELDASGAFVFTRKSEDYARFWFARSEHGSLEVAKLLRADADDDSEANSIGVVFASTRWPITKIADKCGLKVSFYNIHKEMLYTIHDGVAYDIKTPINFEPKYTQKKTTEAGHSSKGSSETTTSTGLVGRRTVSNDFDRLKKMGKIDDNVIRSLRYLKPTQENIRGLQYMTRVFLGQHITEIMCTDCRHYLSQHVTGFCTNVDCTNESVCNTSVPICSGCGCYLIETIHIKNPVIEGGVWCDVCETGCSELKLGKAERKQVRKAAKQRRALDKKLADAVDSPKCCVCNQHLLTTTSKMEQTCLACRIKYNVGEQPLGQMCKNYECTRMLCSEVEMYIGICYRCRQNEQTRGSDDPLDNAYAIAAMENLELSDWRVKDDADEGDGDGTNSEQ